jgi:hypothetical protein
MSAFDRVQECTVRISETEGHGRNGSGFFVAPGYVLTCAHVVEPEADGNPSEFDVESHFGRWRVCPESWRPSSNSDIALLPVPLKEHPCVLFGAAVEPRDQVWSSGFLNRQGEIRLEPVTGEIEGERRARLEVGGPEYTLIKFKGGQIAPGMSGAPLLNEHSGVVCGMVVRTRDEASDAGGLAVPIRTILGGFPFIAEQQSAYHHSHQEWRKSNITMPSVELTDEQKISLLRRLPPGPGVLIAMIPQEIITRFYAFDFTDSASVVLRSNNLRLRADPKIKPHLIALLNTPRAEYGIVDYWHAVFTSAAARGPRMLAALIYEAPPGTFDGIEEVLLSFLASLKTWPVP